VSVALTTKHLEVLKDSTIGTFSAICGAKPTFEGNTGMDPDRGGVRGIIAVVGDLSWSVSLAFPPETAQAIALKFSGFDIPYDSDDMNDVIGELANVMAGDVVARLDSAGVKVKMSLPTVARGTDLELHQPGSITSVKMRFGLPQGPLFVGLAIAKGSEK
jgi:chemotaxis protein CheX